MTPEHDASLWTLAAVATGIGAAYVPGGGYSEGCLMDVAEVLLYGVQHTAAERAAINESLFSYYGLNGYASISS